MEHWLKASLHETITRKAGNSISWRDLSVNGGHGQAPDSRGLSDPGVRDRLGRGEGEVEQALQLARALADVGPLRVAFLAGAEALVGDVQRREHGDLQAVAGGR